ncbi:MAG: ATP-binding protein [Bacteroidota bacterium]
MFLTKVVITGPESTGKSTLAEELSKYYKTNWVKELAREYIEGLNRPYTESDLSEIARGQIKSENLQTESSKKLLICDTDLITVKIWSDYKYGRTDPWILETIEERHYGVYLLTDIDLPWKEDPQREHPDKRAYFLQKFKDELEHYQKSYHLIAGDHKQRFDKAVEIIDRLIP